MNQPSALDATHVNGERLEQLLEESNGNLAFCVAFGVEGLHAKTVMTSAGRDHCVDILRDDPEEVCEALTELLTVVVQREMARVMSMRKR